MDDIEIDIDNARVETVSNKLAKLVSGGDITGYESQRASLCTLGTKVCAQKNELEYMRRLLETKSDRSPTKGADSRAKAESASAIVAATIAELGVADEAAIWQHPRMISIVGRVAAKQIITSNFKQIGPAGSVALLNNFNIDGTMQQWAKHSQTMFGKLFVAIPFQMIDFASRGTELADPDLVYKLIKSGAKCFGVVLNTDVSSGRGKHWFCIYGDLDHAGTAADPHVLEYFNSSGFAPMSEVAAWMEKTIYTLDRDHNIAAARHDSVPKQLQKSHTECGVWSLMYIRSRLDGHPPDWFYSQRTTDDDITRMRQLFFRVGG